MASLIPALSDKAKQIIEDTEPHNSAETVKALRDLFDLEKYPISREMLVNYLHKLDKYSDDFSVVGASARFGSDTDAYSFSANTSNGRIQYSTSIMDAIGQIAWVYGVGTIIIIGDIHGWWEKPQTY